MNIFSALSGYLAIVFLIALVWRLTRPPKPVMDTSIHVQGIPVDLDKPSVGACPPPPTAPPAPSAKECMATYRVHGSSIPYVCTYAYGHSGGHAARLGGYGEVVHAWNESSPQNLQRTVPLPVKIPADWRDKMPKWGKFGAPPPQSHAVIPTRDSKGRPNGYVLPLWSALQTPYRPEQVYLTVVLPGMSKGPHLHKKRQGYFFVIQGDAEFIIRGPDGSYSHSFNGSLTMPGPVHVPADHPCEIRCIGKASAVILNMPTPAWSKQDPDEHPVEGWNPDEHAL